MLSDALARKKAIDPCGSYIVQAPAGSGKTELLTQRFLTLLTRVDAPEQVVALTFTRKAASEMKDRILSTLELAKNADKAALKLQPETFERAQAVLAHSEQHQWDLLHHPHRLRVMTMDALCQSILKQMPLHADFAGQSEIETYPERLYQQAAYQCFAAALEDESLFAHLSLLLKHLDNQQEKLISLWVTLLQARDQWLPIILQAQGQCKSDMEAILRHIEASAMARFANTLSSTEKAALHKWCAAFASFCDLPSWALPLKDWEKSEEISLHLAKCLCQLLLTSQQQFRKRADHHVGLKRDACDIAQFSMLKEESERLFAALAENQALLQSLIEIQALPYSAYDETQWDLLQALLMLLMHLAAHLQLVFKSALRVDFIEVATAALRALGDELAPTDLGLYLDHRIQHLLVDEFQDTSVTQFHFIQRLIAGWEPGDGRTLFVVGDPMQSIYRFRQAEVGLFLQVQHAGMGMNKLTPLFLESNFRSAPALIDWVNTHLSLCFSKQEDMALGAVAFHPAVAARHDLIGAPVIAEAFPSAQAEANAMVKQIQQQLQAFPEESIAILVRSRSQLKWIIPALQKAHIPFEGVDLFPLTDMAYLRDLYVLTQALMMPEARLPWLALLRGPYVGLSLSDLEQVSTQTSSIYNALPALSESRSLSEAGRIRIRHVVAVFERALRLQGQSTLSQWVLHVHLALVGQAYFSPSNWQDVEQYFELLDSFSTQSHQIDWRLFESYFQRLYAKQSEASNLKIMTIHQAKGLEFDMVMMPSLGSITRKSQSSLLRFAQFIQEDKVHVLLSPLKASEENHERIYDYLGRLDDKKSHYELQRLLYVGVTRAKRKLILTDNRLEAQSGSFRASLSTVAFTRMEEQSGEAEDKTKSALYRLPLSNVGIHAFNHLHPGSERPSLAQEGLARQVGIIAHRWIQIICTSQIKTPASVPWEQVAHACKQVGLVEEAYQEAVERLHHLLTTLLQSPRGQWLIDAHLEAQSEYAYCVKEEKGIKTYIVDRYFVADGKRWIIDFKTGQDEEHAHEQHCMQVERYARHLSTQSPEPMHCGIYYVGIDKWVEWAYNELPILAAME